MCKHRYLKIHSVIEKLVGLPQPDLGQIIFNIRCSDLIECQIVYSLFLHDIQGCFFGANSSQPEVNNS